MLAVTGSRVYVDSYGPCKPRTVFIDKKSGKITKIQDGELTESLPNVEVLHAGSSVVMPGVVDAHVHVNEPGRTQWEGFVTATAAAAGGTLLSFFICLSVYWADVYV